MSSVFDSSVVIDILRGREEALRLLASFEDPPTCSEVTRVEVLRGVRSHERRATEALLAQLGWATVDERIARQAGEYGRLYRKSHTSIGTSDLIIAATARVTGLPLATRNVRHFPMFRGLRPPY